MAALILGLCLAAACRGGVAASMTSLATAESQASTWLRARGGAPKQDELAELKAVNPSAYAIVKALLTKRSLGLLDPKHPTASFASGPPSSGAAEDGSVPQGAEAFERIAEESGDRPKPQVALAYPDVATAPAHHDWLNWKPSQSAMDDDAMVKNVLGAVAELKGSKGAPNLRGQGHVDSDSDASDALQWRDSTAAVSAPPAVPAAPAAPAATVDVKAKPQAAMSQENSYLKGIDFGLEAQPVQSQQPQASQENTYLKGISFGSDSAPSTAAAAAPASVAPQAAPVHMAQLGLHTATEKKDSRDYLASFSWDDDVPSQKAPQVGAATARTSADGNKPSKVPAAKASGSSHGSNALLAWLGGSAPAAAVTAPKAATKPVLQQSSYMMDLQ